MKLSPSAPHAVPSCAMTETLRRRHGFWYQTGRPFRAAGRGLGWLWEMADLVGSVVALGRGIVWIFRGAGRLLATIFD